MIKKLLGFVIAMPLLAIFAVPVSAQEEPPCTPTAHGSGNAAGCTVNFHNLTDTFTDVVPCTDPPVPAVISISNANAIFHITTLANDTYWATFTEQGDFVAVAANGLTYTGHFAMWDGENWNLNNTTFTATFNVHGTASDGSVLNAHSVAHVNFDATGVPHFAMHMIC